MLYTLRFFSLQNAVCFIMLTCLVPVLFIFYIHGVLKLIKNNSGAKGLKVTVLQAISRSRFKSASATCRKAGPRCVISDHDLSEGTINDQEQT